MADRAELMAEAFRRGILPPEKRELYAEAVRRGLVKASDEVKTLAKAQEAVRTPAAAEPLRQFGRQATLGLSEAFPAAVFATGEALRGRSFNQGYDAARRVQKEETQERASPLNTVAGVAGGLGTLAVGGGGVLKAGAPLAIRAGRGIATAGALGAAGAGAESEHLRDVPRNLVAGGMTGAALGALGEGAVAGGGAFLRRAGAKVADKAAAFERAGVRPTMAAVGGEGMARVSKAIAENPIAGIRARGALRASIDDTGKAAERVAAGYGTPMARGASGEAVQGGIRQFNERFSKRAGAMYDKAFDNIEAGQSARLASTSAGDKAFQRVQGYKPQPRVAVKPTETISTLKSILGRVNNEAIAGIVNDPKIGTVVKALETSPETTRFRDLRQLRTWAREAQADPQLRQGLSEADLGRMESALTNDIGANAERLAGPRAARQLAQADQFYRLGSQRINGALQAFVGKGAPKSGESAYDLVLRAASDRGGADTARLTALKKSLTPEQFGDVAASAIARMGRHKPGSPEALSDGFNVNSFLTNYASLSPHGRNLLFGAVDKSGKSGELRGALDNLAHVVSMQKGVEAAANHSNTMVSGQAAATVVGLLTPHATLPTVGALGSSAALGEALTNAGFVRFLASKAPRNATEAAEAARKLAVLSKRDPAVKALQQHIAPIIAGHIGAAQRTGADQTPPSSL